MTTTSSSDEPIERNILPGIVEESLRRWPDDGIGPRERWWPLRRGFREGATWAFGRPTDDARIEAARRAGQIEALNAIDGYLRLQTQNLEGPDAWKQGVRDLSGRLQHMTAEARGQIKSETAVRLLGES